MIPLGGFLCVGCAFTHSPLSVLISIFVIAQDFLVLSMNFEKFHEKQISEIFFWRELIKAPNF